MKTSEPLRLHEEVGKASKEVIAACQAAIVMVAAVPLVAST
jgi:hypothetical protein